MRDTLTLTLSAMSLTSTTLWAAPRPASRCSSRTSLRNCSREVTACVTTADFRTGSRDPALLFSCAILMKTPSMLERTIADVIGYLRRPLRRRPLPPFPATCFNTIDGIRRLFKLHRYSGADLGTWGRAQWRYLAGRCRALDATIRAAPGRSAQGEWGGAGRPAPPETGALPAVRRRPWRPLPASGWDTGLPL